MGEPQTAPHDPHKKIIKQEVKTPLYCVQMTRVPLSIYNYATAVFMVNLMHTTELSVGKQGRIVIPANLRQQLAIKPGSQLLAWVENGRLIMETREQLWQFVHQACSQIPKDVSLAQELIDERRESAKQEI